MEEETIKERIDNRLNQFEEKLVPKFPENILLELSNICNHECIFCANSKMTRKKGEIDEKFLYRILKEAYELGTRELGFYATGEPLVVKNLEKYIKYAKDIGYEYVYITTNGALFDEVRMRNIIKNGIDSIKFSINASTQETYKIIHGKDDFDKVLKNLIFIDNYRKQKNIDLKLYVSYVITKQNYEEVNMIKKKVEEIVDDIVFVNARNQGGNMYEINEYLCVEETRYDKLSSICSLPFNTFTVTYEGYMSACCLDFQNYLIVADLNYISLKEAWESKEFTNLRKCHINNKLEDTICYNCRNNTTNSVKPLTPEYCIEFDYKDFDGTKNIIKRLK